jgi:hypothetical protein
MKRFRLHGRTGAAVGASVPRSLARTWSWADLVLWWPRSVVA